MHEKGLILSLESKKIGRAKMTSEGSLKLNIAYNAQILCLFGRYIEVKVIDDYDIDWIGDFMGITVKGRGGSGSIRGCRAVRFEENKLVVEAIGEAGNESWLKLWKKVSRIL